MRVKREAMFAGTRPLYALQAEVSRYLKQLSFHLRKPNRAVALQTTLDEASIDYVRYDAFI
jgi:hypothetical protein